ncbi:MAG TPA: hypothetical protein IAA08_00665, partial [Candidatus Eubacterium avistercoris]|nr:hypothetical protein [Candidatus Eubacterium avistercoris]
FPSAVTRDFARRVGFGKRIVLCDYVVEELRVVVERKFPNRKKILACHSASSLSVEGSYPPSSKNFLPHRPPG